jgi:hypothetical protein
MAAAAARVRWVGSREIRCKGHQLTSFAAEWRPVGRGLGQSGLVLIYTTTPMYIPLISHNTGYQICEIHDIV